MGSRFPRDRGWGPSDIAARLGLATLIVGVSCLASALAVFIGAAASAKSADWATQQTFPIAQYVYHAIACPSQGHCFAVGTQITSGASVIVATTDGGAHWNPQSLPAGTGPLAGVACTSNANCWAVGSNPGFTTGVVLSTTDGGQTWNTQGLPAGTGPLFSITCASTSACRTVGANFPDFVRGTGNSGILGNSGPGSFFGPVHGIALATTDGGATWSNQNLPSGAGPLSGVTCASPSNCWAVGSDPTDTNGIMLSTTDGGGHWGTQTVPGGVGPLAAVACTSSSDCRAVGTTPIAGKGALIGMIIGTTDAGSTWSSETLPNGSGPLATLACPSATRCLAGGAGFTGGDGVVLAINSGTTWSAQTLPNGTGPIAGLACTSTTDCSAVGGNAYGGFGVTPTTARAALHTPAVRASVARASVSSGLASASLLYGYSGLIVATSDGGSTWRSQAVSSSGLTSLSALSCPQASTCWALATNASGIPVVLATTDAWKTWTTQSVPTGIDELSGITCVSTSNCWAVGGNITYAPTSIAVTGVVVVTTDGGTTWTSETVPADTGLLTGVACASSSDCWAVGNNVLKLVGTMVATTDGGATWHDQVLPNGTGVLAGVACPSISTCWAVGSQPVRVGGAIAATTDGGATWKLQSPPELAGPFLAIACPSVTTCWAVGASFNGAGVAATTDGGATWVAQSLPRGVQGLTSISCPSTNDCWAAGGASFFGGVGPIGIPVGIPPFLGGGSIVATTDGGSLWSVQSLPSDVVNATAVSCPSTTSCWASGETQRDFAVLAELGVTVTPTTTVPPPVTVPIGGAAPYELYCPGTPVGSIVLNNVATAAQLSPPDPAPGGQFNVVGYQTQVVIPSSIASAAAALGNTDIAGSATTAVDASGATPSSISTGSMAFDAVLPNPVPASGVVLVIPPTAGTVGPFTASGGPITITQDAKAQLTLQVSGSTLNLSCTAYPNNSAATGITSQAPQGSPAAPTIATATGNGPTTTTGPAVTSDPSTTLVPTTLGPTTSGGSTAPGGSNTTVAFTGTTARVATAARSGSSSPGTVSASSGALAFTGPGPGIVFLGGLGAALMLVGIVLLGLTEAPRRVLYRLALARAAWRIDQREQSPAGITRHRSYQERLGAFPASVQRGGRILSHEVAHTVRWLLGR